MGSAIFTRIKLVVGVLAFARAIACINQMEKTGCKCNGMQSQICKVIVNDQEITDPDMKLGTFMNLFLKRVTQNLPPILTIFWIRFGSASKIKYY